MLKNIQGVLNFKILTRIKAKDAEFMETLRPLLYCG